MTAGGAGWEGTVQRCASSLLGPSERLCDARWYVCARCGCRRRSGWADREVRGKLEAPAIPYCSELAQTCYVLPHASLHAAVPHARRLFLRSACCKRMAKALLHCALAACAAVPAHDFA